MIVFQTAVGVPLLLALLVRHADLSITHGMQKSMIRAICYGLTTLILLIALILVFLGR